MTHRISMVMLLVMGMSVVCILTAQETPAEPETPAAVAAKEAPVDQVLEEDFMGSQNQPERASEAFSLKDITLLTLKNNLNVQIKEKNPRIAQTDVVKAEAVFDPTVQASLSGGKTDTPALGVGDSIEHDRAESTTGSAALTKRFLTGTEASVGVSASHSKGDDFDSSVSSQAGVEITHPLLKGGGVTVNEVDIFIARNNTRISQWDFKSQVISTLAQSQTTYWELVFALENLEVQKRSWRLSKKTLMQTEAQVEAGVLARIEITRVRADVASKEEGIISAQRAVEDQVDQLRRFIRQSGSDLEDDTGIVPLERVAYEPVRLELKKEIRAGLLNRPDYMQAKIDTENRDLEIVRAKNGRLPQLDLKASVDVNGLGHGESNSFDSLGEGDFVDWNLGATFSYPLGNRAADAAYARAHWSMVQSGLQVKNVADQVVIDVKAAVRKVNADGQRVRSTRLARQLAEERLAAEEEKLNVGQAIILDLLEAQTLVAQTEAAERRAIVDYQESLIQLEQAKGTLLESNHVFLAR